MKVYAFSAFALAAFATAISMRTAEAINNTAAINYPRPAAQLYSKYCDACHGKDGRAKTIKGKFNHARDLTDGKWQDDVSDERIYNSIMNGRNVRGNMPAFSKKLTSDEADSLVTYVRRLKQ